MPFDWVILQGSGVKQGSKLWVCSYTLCTPIPPYLGLAATAETTTGENGNQNENGNNEYSQRQCSWSACGVICKCKRTVLKYILLKKNLRLRDSTVLATNIEGYRML